MSQSTTSGLNTGWSRHAPPTLSIAIAGLNPNTPDRGSAARKRSPGRICSAAPTLPQWVATLA